MLWRVRTTLPDRPGALAALAQECGAAGVNILGFQIFPGVAAVTDELVVRTPAGWTEAQVTALLERAGGSDVVGTPCTDAALVDQPARYVQAARAVIAQPSRFPEVVAQLFDAEAASGDAEAGGDVLDLMEMTVGDVRVQVRRRAPFTATEHARGAAMADLVSDVLARTPSVLGSANRRMGGGATLSYEVVGLAVRADVGGTVVGAAQLRPASDPATVAEPGLRAVDLEVDPAWQRRGIGTRLLADIARLAAGEGADDIVLATRADNQAVLPMVLAAGLRGRIRMAADVLTVRIPVRDLTPLRR
ncbi:MAG TPA: GNAT family N-acetyltransferase [Nocardioides sp.]